MPAPDDDPVLRPPAASVAVSRVVAEATRVEDSGKSLEAATDETVKSPQSEEPSVDSSPSSPIPADGDARSLFDELPEESVPGNLHLAPESTINRFVDRYGIVTVVRQLAKDLAEREAQVALMRRQSEDRERELRRMLSEANVSRIDIDRRLLNMEATSVRNPRVALDHLMSEALDTSLDQTPVPASKRPAWYSILSGIQASSPDPISPEGRATPQPSSTSSNTGSRSGSKTDPAPLPSLDTVTSPTPKSGDQTAQPDSSPTVTRTSHSSRTSVVPISRQLFSESTTNPNGAKPGPPTAVPNHTRDRLLPDNASTTSLADSFQDSGPLELEDIVPHDIQPPALAKSKLLQYNEKLIDRFGFVYEPTRRTNQSVSNDAPESDALPRPGTPTADKENTNSLKSNSSEVSLKKRSHSIISHMNAMDTGFAARPSGTAPASATVAMSDSQAGGPRTNEFAEPQRSIGILLAKLSDLHDETQKSQTQKWDDFLHRLRNSPNVIEVGELLGIHGSLLRKNKSPGVTFREFSDLVYDGVALSYRPKLWGECSGAWTLKEPGTYEDLVAQTPNPEAVAQIDLDLHRTMPHNIFFAGTGPGVDKLRRVLVAFSNRNPDVGYCQGMNMIVAVLLLTYATEEDSFWSFVSLVENILPESYFAPPLRVARASQAVLNLYFDRLLPQLVAQFHQVGVDIEAITFDWLLSCLTEALPVEVLLRVWDVLFCIEGEAYLFRVALALFKLHEWRLLEMDSAADIYSFMKSLSRHPIQPDALIKCAESFSSVNKDEIAALRSKIAESL